MGEDKCLDKKLNELDEKLDVVSIRKYYKARLIKRINKGEVGLLPKLEQLEKIEQQGAASSAPTPDASRPTPHAGEAEGEEHHRQTEAPHRPSEPETRHL